MILKLGDKGEDVKVLQSDLQTLGFYKDAVDGDFGKITFEAVKAFQLKNNLLIDGIVGQKTLDKINQVLNKPNIPITNDCIIPYVKMTNTNLTPDLRAEYSCLWKKCIIKVSALAEVDKIVNTINSNKIRYQGISNSLGGIIPWFFVGVIHNLECSLNFNQHLHNGDSLQFRTKNVPAGRPLTNPPFTFEESARDALKMKGFDKQTDWTIEDILYKLERYNGFGYRQFHYSVKSPYLWSKSNHYIKGKYVADGKWDVNAISQQMGAAVLLKRMEEKKFISI